MKMMSIAKENEMATLNIYILFFVIAFLIITPLLPTNIISTTSNDLANHVRHIYEYKLAILEGQFPPLVAPELNGGIRIPLFQYYSGTAYIFPALFSLLGINEYSALKLTIFLLSSFAAISLFNAFSLMLCDKKSAWIGALTFQLFTFSLVDLYTRGAAVEWIALQYAAITFYSLIGLCNSLRDKKLHIIMLYLLFSIFCMTFFIACHPIQTLYMGLVLALLLLIYNLTLDDSKLFKMKLLGIMGFAFLISLILTSWFWLPILENFSNIKVIQYGAFFSADTTLWTVLFPWFHESQFFHWAPQVGVHITLSALFLTVMVRKNNLFSNLVLLLLVSLLFILTSASNVYPNSLLLYLFHPLQWSYRLIMTLAIVAALTVALAASHILSHCNQIVCKNWLVILSCLIILNSLPYFYNTISTAHYSQTLANIKSFHYFAPNSTTGYTLAGINYKSLNWFHDGKLKLNSPLELPKEGVPFETRLSLDKICNIKVLVDNNQTQQLQQRVKGKTILTFSVYPSAGLNPHHVVTFQSSSSESAIITDYQYRAIGDKNWFRIPENYYVEKNKNNFHAIAMAYTQGLYQLPLSYFPNAKICVNGKLALHQSADKFLLVTLLQRGSNIITTQCNIKSQ